MILELENLAEVFLERRRGNEDLVRFGIEHSGPKIEDAKHRVLFGNRPGDRHGFRPKIQTMEDMFDVMLFRVSVRPGDRYNRAQAHRVNNVKVFLQSG